MPERANAAPKIRLAAPTLHQHRAAAAQRLVLAHAAEALGDFGIVARDNSG
jgi:hypothetical protein